MSPFRFTKIDYHELRYDSLNDFNCSHVVLETGNSAQILRLRWNQSGKEFFVTNTHLYWRPEACAIKLKQSFMLIEKLLDLRGDNQDPVILCGGIFRVRLGVGYNLNARRLEYFSTKHSVQCTDKEKSSIE